MTVSITTKYGLFGSKNPTHVHPVVEARADLHARTHNLSPAEYPRLLVCRHVGKFDVSPLQFSAKTLLGATALERFSTLSPLSRIFGPRPVPQRWSLALLPDTPTNLLHPELQNPETLAAFDAALDHAVTSNSGFGSIANLDRAFPYLMGHLPSTMALRLIARPTLHSTVESYHDTFLTIGYTFRDLEAQRTAAMRELRILEAIFMYQGQEIIINGAFAKIPDYDPRHITRMTTPYQSDKTSGPAL